MGYIKKIKLINFQSHRNTEISFSEGLTVILGPTDQGKSAIIRALKWVLYNEPRGSDFVTVGCKYCNVTLEMGDGTIITRERDGNKNRYILKKDGQEKIFEGFGNSVPLEITKAHGIPKIRIDQDSATAVNLAEQLEPPFLISESGSTKAKVLGQLVGVHILDAAQRSTVKDLMDLEQRKKALNNEILSIKEELKNYTDLPEFEKKLDLLIRLINTIKTKRWMLSKILEIKQKLEPTFLGIKEAEGILSKTAYVKDAEMICLKIINSTERLTRLEALSKSIKETDQQMLYSRSFLRNTENVFLAEKISKELELIKEKVQKYKDIQNKITLIDEQIRIQSDQLESYKQIQKVDDHINDIFKKNSELSLLTNIRENIISVNASIKKGETYLKQLVESLNSMTEKYAFLLKRLSRCPTCLSPIDEKTAERIIIEIQES